MERKGSFEEKTSIKHTVAGNKLTHKAEELLINNLVYGVLYGLSNKNKVNKLQETNVKYSNIRIEKSKFLDYNCWNVISDIQLKKKTKNAQVTIEENNNTNSLYTFIGPNNEETTNTYRDVWLASIPRLDEDGMFTIGGNKYYTVIRQKLVQNVPIVTRKENKYSRYVCQVRSVNYDTLESRSVSIYREKSSQGRIILDLGMESVRNVDLVNYMKTLMNKLKNNPSISMESVVEIIELFTSDTNIINLVICDFNNNYISSNNPSDIDIDYIFPSCVDIEGNDIQSILPISYDHISSELFTLFAMYYKLLNAELYNIVDDLNDYKNKVVEEYSVLFALILRRELYFTGPGKLIARCNYYNGDDRVDPLVHQQFVDAITNNKWLVVDDYKSDLQLSRTTDPINEFTLKANMEEVIVVMGTHSSSLLQQQQYFGVRHIHPSQIGFICIARTSDDTNAGLRNYLTLDTIVSNNYKLYYNESYFNKSYSEKLANLRGLLDDSDESEYTHLWIHDDYVIGSVNYDKFKVKLREYRNDNNTFCWNIEYGTNKKGVLYSRGYYGRLLAKVTLKHQNSDKDIELYVDTKEIKRLEDESTDPLDSSTPSASPRVSMDSVRTSISRDSRSGSIENIRRSRSSSTSSNSSVNNNSNVVNITNNNRDTNANNNNSIDNSSKYSKYKIIKNKFSRICYEIPFINMMPSPRLTLGSKIMSKSKPDYEVFHNNKMYNNICNTYLERPLVRTTESDGYVCGNNVWVLYTTYEGLGVEDAVVINKSSIERGLFQSIQRIKVEWTRDHTIHLITDFSIYVKKYQKIKKDQLLGTIKWNTEDGKENMVRMRHTGSYICTIEDVYITYSDISTKPKDLYSLTFLMTRLKNMDEGDKLSSKYGQKSVVKIISSEDLPIIEDSTGRFPTTPDIIVNPLSILSRGTISQNVSSTLGIKALEEIKWWKMDAFIEKPFSNTITKRCKVGNGYVDLETMNIKDLKNYEVNLIDGKTGVAREGSALLGLEYYLSLMHIADLKVRSKGNIKKDLLTGSIGNSIAEGAVKYNWQELVGLEHNNAKELLSHIYTQPGDVGKYPYCETCNIQKESHEVQCAICGNVISGTIKVSKSFTIVKYVTRCLGCDIEVVGEKI